MTYLTCLSGWVASLLGCGLLQMSLCAAAVAAAAEGPPGADPAPTDAMETVSLTSTGRLIGDGPFQCGIRPGCYGINPSGTLVAAADWFGHSKAVLMVFTIPEGQRRTLELTPMAGSFQLQWVDDQRLVVLGLGSVSITTTALSEDGWRMDVHRHRESLYALVDVTTSHVRVSSLPPDLYGERMAVGADHRTACIVVAPFPGTVAPVPLIGLKSQRGAPACSIMQWDLASGAMRWGGDIQMQTTALRSALVALQGDTTRYAVLLTRSARAQGSQLVIGNLAGPEAQRRVALPPGPDLPVALQWGPTAEQIEIQMLGTDLSTLRLSLTSGRWSTSHGWSLRPQRAAGPRSPQGATVGLHAVTLADGRYVPLLPRAFRRGDLYHSRYGVTATGLLGPLLTDQALHYGVTVLGNCLQVMDLRHSVALSPTPESICDGRGDPRYLDSGELALSGNQATLLVPDQGPVRIVPFQEEYQGSVASSGRWLLARSDQGRMRMVDALTGLSHAVPGGDSAYLVEMSPDGSRALMRFETPQLRMARLDHPQDSWDLPCTVNPRTYQMGVTWGADRTTCYLAEEADPQTPDGCTGAWSLVARSLLWRPQDAAGQDVTSACALVPDPRGHRVLLQYRTAEDIQRVAPRCIADDTAADQNLRRCALLDADSGHWLRSLANPGRNPGFTPDGQRVVGTLGVVSVAANRLVQAFGIPSAEPHRIFLSPSRTWMLWLPRSGDWQLRDCAQCGIVIRIRRPAAVPEREQIATVVWDASEQHCAMAFLLYSCVYTMPLLPEARGRSAFDPSAVARLDAASGWLAAAQELSCMGAPAVMALARAPKTAHRLIALELCARRGEHAADALLAAAGALPLPLGSLAHDCAFRIRQLRLQQQAAAHPVPVPASSPAPTPTTGPAVQ